jgi:hypothetical protein
MHICKYACSVRAAMEDKCGVKFGSGDVPMPVHVPKALRGVILQRGEGTLERLAVFIAVKAPSSE